MKILVTGGAGFIASHIVDAYISLGHEVLVLDNLSSGNKKNLNPKARFYEMDICDVQAAEFLRREKPEMINHHAAHIDVRRSVAEPHHDLKINVGGTLNLLSACRDIRLKKVIFSSTGGALYGEQIQFPATEEHSLNPASPYGINKLAAEKYLSYFSRLYGFKLTCLRYANVYGPRQNAHGEAGVVAIFINALLSGRTPIINGDGTQTRDYVYVEDIVRLNVKALEQDLIGSFNVGTGHETNVNQIYSHLAKLMDYNHAAIHGAAKPGEQMRSCLDSSRIHKTCGYAPDTPLATGLKKTFDWFKRRELEVE